MAKGKAESKANTITLSSGVVLELRRVGYWIVYEATRRLKKPEVPVQFIEEKGRPEENPAHPDYLAALEQYEQHRADLVINTYLWFGTKLVSTPTGMLGPDTDWAEEFAFLGIEPIENRQERYAQWLKLVACRGDADEITKLTQRITSDNAVTETEVAVAAESFRGDA